MAEANGWRRLLTNSAKLVNIIGGYGYRPTLASLERCIDAAVAGRIVEPGRIGAGEGLHRPGHVEELHVFKGEHHDQTWSFLQFAHGGLPTLWQEIAGTMTLLPRAVTAKNSPIDFDNAATGRRTCSPTIRRLATSGSWYFRE